VAVLIDGGGREWVSGDAMDRVLAREDSLLKALREEVERQEKLREQAIRDGEKERTAHGENIEQRTIQGCHAGFADRLLAIIDQHEGGGGES
jgi:hypothetical protein